MSAEETVTSDPHNADLTDSAVVTPEAPVYVFSRLRRPAIWVVALVIIGYAIYRAIMAFVSIDANLLWFRSVHHDSAYTRTFWSELVLFVIFAGLTLVVVTAAIFCVYRFRPLFRPDPLKQRWRFRYHANLHPLRFWLLVIAVVWASVSVGAIASSHWQAWLEWRNAVPFGQRDAQFHRDISYYVDVYPMHRLALSLAFRVLVYALIATIVVGYVYGAWRWRGPAPRTTRGFRVQLAVVLGLIFVLKAYGYWLDRFATATSSRGVVTGPSYTDVHALIPGKSALVVIAFICAAIAFVAASRASMLLLGGAVGLMWLSALMIGVLRPAVVQQFHEKPNAASNEAPYIARNIAATRTAFGLDGSVVDEQSPGQQDVSNAALHRELAQSQIRLLDPNRLSATFTQLQHQRSFYTFKSTLDVDRYPIDGRLQDVLVAPRELKLAGIPKASWTNRHLVYTHGYGLVAAPTTTTGAQGLPQFAERDIPPTGALGAYNPRIYYGQLGPSYSIVGAPPGSKPHEFDRPAATGSGQVDNTHTGGGGIPISSLLNRLVYSIKLGDPSILFSSGINHDSQLLTVRNPTARVAAVAPWLTLDGDAYPVAEGGHVLWVVDGYTSTKNYPYSQQVNLRSATRTTYVANGSTSAQPNTSVNYLHNSVKATVDANTGQVHLYAWNQSAQPDPLLQMWEQAFPGLVEPQSAIPAALLPHLRYPQDLFNVQRTLLAKYHVTDPRQFYSGSDFWKVPSDPTTGPTPTRGPAIPSTYMTLSPDGSQPATFALSTPMATLDRRNLAAFISVDSQPGPGYGKITVLQFPTNRTVEGPSQVQQLIESDPQVAQQLTLLRGGHSRVVLGNLLTIPLGGNVMYAEPIYTQAKGSRTFPSLQRVIVRYNGRFGYRSTLRSALDQALGRP